MSVKVNIVVKQKSVKIPTGTRLLIRKACNATLKFENFEAQISLRDPNNKEKYIGTDENWHLAETAIIELV